MGTSGQPVVGQHHLTSRDISGPSSINRPRTLNLEQWLHNCGQTLPAHQPTKYHRPGLHHKLRTPNMNGCCARCRSPSKRIGVAQDSSFKDHGSRIPHKLDFQASKLGSNQGLHVHLDPLPSPVNAGVPVQGPVPPWLDLFLKMYIFMSQSTVYLLNWCLSETSPSDDPNLCSQTNTILQVVCLFRQ